MATAIVHFEVHASDPMRAKKFYEDVFGWEISQWGDQQYWMIKSGRSNDMNGSPIGIDGGLLPRQGGEPVEGAAVNGYVCALAVEEIDTVASKVKDAGGQVVLEKFAIGDMGWQAACKDTEGNIFSLWQNAPAAA